jgi:hypothetical protein
MNNVPFMGGPSTQNTFGMGMGMSAASGLGGSGGGFTYGMAS